MDTFKLLVVPKITLSALQKAGRTSFRCRFLNYRWLFSPEILKTSKLVTFKVSIKF